VARLAGCSGASEGQAAHRRQPGQPRRARKRHHLALSSGSLSLNARTHCTHPPAQDAVPLIIKVLSKSMDSSLTGEKVELATLTRDEASGAVSFRIYESSEIQPLLDAANAEKEKADAASS
jgi:hypothetical protein